MIGKVMSIYLYTVTDDLKAVLPFKIVVIKFSWHYQLINHMVQALPGNYTQPIAHAFFALQFRTLLSITS